VISGFLTKNSTNLIEKLIFHTGIYHGPFSFSFYFRPKQFCAPFFLVAPNSSKMRMIPRKIKRSSCKHSRPPAEGDGLKFSKRLNSQKMNFSHRSELGIKTITFLIPSGSKKSKNPPEISFDLSLFRKKGFFFASARLIEFRNGFFFFIS